MDEPGLIRDAQRGDLDAFNTLVLAYQTQAYNVAYRVMGEADAAADATQEAFISAYKNIRSYRGGSFRAWLLRIVTNACYDELRRRKRKPAVSLEALTVVDSGPDATGEAQLVSDVESPEAHAQRRELADAIQECIEGLPDDMRMVVVLSDMQALDYSEIALSLNIALGTVKSRLSRARARVRDCLGQTAAELLPSAFRLGEESAS
jgi:RNA polymerase sigma-70 factor (ECF subfamily)